MTATFKQIRNNKDISEKEGFGTMVFSSLIFVGIGVLMIMLSDINPLITVILMLLLAFVGRPLIRRLFGDFARNSDIIGELMFDTNCIRWEENDTDQRLNTIDIISLNLRYNYIQGRQFASKDIIHNGLAELTIHLKAGESVQVKFLIETEKQLTDLKPIWKEYYRQKIKIKEIMGRYEIRTILFEKDDLSFAKFQELKKELNVDSF